MASYLDTKGLKTLWEKITNTFLKVDGSNIMLGKLICADSLTIDNNAEQDLLCIGYDGDWLIYRQTGIYDANGNPLFETKPSDATADIKLGQSGKHNVTVQSDLDVNGQLYVSANIYADSSVIAEGEVHAGSGMVRMTEQGLSDEEETQVLWFDPSSPDDGIEIGDPTQKYSQLSVLIPLNVSENANFEKQVDCYGSIYARTNNVTDIQHTGYNSTLNSYSVQRILTDLLYRADNTSSSGGSTADLGLTNSKLYQQMSADTDGTMTGYGAAGATNSGGFFKVLRLGDPEPAFVDITQGIHLQDGNAILFGGTDTKATMAVSYYNPYICFTGGSNNSPNWKMAITGTTGKVYNLDSLSGDYLPLSGGTLTGALTVQGDINATGEVTAYATSDERQKRNIEEADCLTLLKALGRVCKFDYKTDGSHSVGFIAQEIDPDGIFADIVTTDKDGYLKVNYWDKKLIAAAIGAVGQLAARVDTLEQRLAQLEGKEVSHEL